MSPVIRRARTPGRMLVVLTLTLAALSLTTAPALSATEGTTLSEAQANKALQRVQEREARRAQRKAEAEQLRRERIQEQLRARTRAREKREEAGGKRHTPHGYVDITCATITWHFENFSKGKHTITEITSIDGTHLPRVSFTFEGPTGSNVTPVGAAPGVHSIDAFAKWVDEGVRGSWDIDSRRTCGTGNPGASYVIEKRQKILGSLTGFVPTPLTGEVGKTIEYQIVVTNTGTEFLVISGFSDPHCDPGTIKGGLEGPLGPGESALFSCTHVITPADQEAGSYTNTATVTGTPFGGGEEKRQETNTVVVTVLKPGEEPKKGGGGGEEPKTPGTGSGPNVGEATGTTGVLGTIAGSQGKNGTLAVTASVPALLGRPHGCARSSFLVSVRSKGVRAVTFYLDNRKLKKLTYKNARAGKLSVRVQTARLRVGVHRLKARITMNPLTASAKAVIATRSLTFARCASATLRPRFTG
jgi:hypothetical protein